ncbi:MAG TPA: glycosyltransferase family 9 protein [Acidobacteriaceae bacterium]|jgi:heptosyltransferase-3|nr:glycosyltransferase family 9 protein [Acidobacteriaceae bacterium]
MTSRDHRAVLIYRLGSLGDTIVALPALHVIEQAFPSARKMLLTNIPVHVKAPAAAAILEGSGLVHGYVSYPLGMRNVRGLVRLWWRIRQFRPDVLVYLAQPRGQKALERDRKFFRLCGIRKIVGLPVGDLGEPAFDGETGLWEREAQRLLRCVDELSAADVNDLSLWDLRLTAAELKKGNDALTPLGGMPLIGCGPGTKMQAKDWGQENWRALLTRLSEALPNHGLALVGAKEDWDVSDYAAVAWKGRAVNLCGELTPRETAAVVKSAEAFLGPDSGPMHLAAAYGVPCVIAFASLDRPGRWFPIGKSNRPIYHDVDCANCRLQVCIEQKKKCILSITVDEMLEAALDAIGRKQSECRT